MPIVEKEGRECEGFGRDEGSMGSSKERGGPATGLADVPTHIGRVHRVTAMALVGIVVLIVDKKTYLYWMY